MTQRLEGRIALITGASRGIGAAVARRFAAEGAHVILVGRTVGALEEVDDAIRAAGGEAATLVDLDLRQFDKIDQLGAALFERFGRLDVLVGNAGFLGALGPMGHLDLKLWDQVIQTNLTANWRLIRSMEPLLRLSPSGRAIFVTDHAARHMTAYWSGYAVAKAGLEAMVRTWALELGPTNIRANLIDPGPVGTRLRTEAFPGIPPESLPQPDSVTEGFVTLAEAACPHQGAVIGADGQPVAADR